MNLTSRLGTRSICLLANCFQTFSNLNEILNLMPYFSNDKYVPNTKLLMGTCLEFIRSFFPEHVYRTSRLAFFTRETETRRAAMQCMCNRAFPRHITHGRVLYVEPPATESLTPYSDKTFKNCQRWLVEFNFSWRGKKNGLRTTCRWAIFQSIPQKEGRRKCFHGVSV